MKKSYWLLTFLFVFVATTFSFAQSEADRLVGVWEPSNGKARVKIDKIGDKYFGRIVWLKEKLDPQTKKPKLDKNNPDEALQKTPLLGYRMLKDFSYKGDDVWEDGTIYDPENGNTYNCIITMKDENTLDIRGFIGIKTLGRTDVWKRLKIPARKKN